MTEDVLKEAFEKHVGATVERVDLDPRKVSGSGTISAFSSASDLPYHAPRCPAQLCAGAVPRCSSSAAGAKQGRRISVGLRFCTDAALLTCCFPPIYLLVSPLQDRQRPDSLPAPRIGEGNLLEAKVASSPSPLPAKPILYFLLAGKRSRSAGHGCGWRPVAAGSSPCCQCRR